MTDVFISYSRKDKPFLQRLHTALAAQGRDIWVDWEDIPATADWWREIETGIEATNTFLFAMTPDSLASPMCMMEVAHAIRHNKRVIPVVHRMADEKESFAALAERELDPDTLARLSGRSINDLASENWRTLSRHNWLMFRDEDNFDENFGKLVEAIETDLDHVKEHTRLLVRAREWDSRDRNPSLLLNGTEIAAAEAWLSAGAAKMPLPTEIHSAYIIASRHAAARRLQITIAALVVGIVIAVALAIFGLVQSNIATNALGVANEESTRAVAAAATATNALGVAEVRGTEAADRAVEAEIARNDAYAQATIAADRAVEAHNARSTSEARGTDVAVRRDEALVARNEAYDQATIAAENALAAVEARSTSEARGTVAADRAAEAEIARNEAYDQATLAAERAIEAETNLRDSRENQSRFLADLSRQALEGGKPQTALLLALESLAYFQDYHIGDSTNLNALAAAINSRVQEVAYFAGGVDIKGAAISPDLTRVIVWSAEEDGSDAVRVWSTRGTLIGEISDESGYYDVSWNTDFSRVLLTTAEIYDLVQWDVNTDEVYTWEDRYYYDIALSPDGQRATAYTLDLEDHAQWVLIDVTSGEDVTAFDWPVTDAQVYPEFNATSSRLLVIMYVGADTQTELYDADGTLIDQLAVNEDVPFVRWTRDGQRVLVPTAQGHVYVYAAADADTQLTLQLNSQVWDAVWSADETEIITSNAIGRVQVWDMRGNILYGLPHTSAVLYTIPSADNRRLLTTETLDALTLWDVAGEDNLGSINLDSDFVDAAWNLSGSGFFVLVSDGEVEVYTANGDLLHTIAHEDKIRAAKWLDDLHVFTWGADGSARVWNLEATPPGAFTHFAAVFGAAWNGDETRLLTWSGDGSARVWDSSRSPLFELQHDDVVMGAAWNADFTRILTWSLDGSVRTWDAQSGTELMRVDPDPLPYHAEWMGDDGVLTLAGDPGSENGVVTLWNSDGSVRAQIEPGEPLTDVVWSEAGIVTTGGFVDGDGTIRFYDPLGDLLNTVTLPDAGQVMGVRWNADRSRLFVWTSAGEGRIYSAAGEEVADLGRVGQLNDVEWSADGSRLVLAATDGYIPFTDLNGRDMQFRVNGRQANGAAWSPDSQRLLTWGNDGYARIFDSDGTALLLGHGADANVLRAQWSHDGTRVLSVVENQVFVWDAQTGDVLAEFDQNDAILDALWGAGDTHILSWGYDSTARVWPLDLPTLIAEGESIRIRDLSQFERARAYLAAPLNIDQVAAPTPTPGGLPPTPVPKEGEGA